MVRFDRFSPYFDHPEQFGLTNLRPYPAYRYIYPYLSDTDLFCIAYYFQADFARSSDVSRHTQSLRANLAQWKRAQAASQLFATQNGERLVIWDHRAGTKSPVHILEGPTMQAYELCDDIQDVNLLYNKMSSSMTRQFTADELAGWLASLVERGLMVREGKRYLSLAVKPDTGAEQVWLSRLMNPISQE